MNAKIIFISITSFLITCNVQLFGGGWELLQNSPTTNDLHSVYFLDDNTGWIAGDNSTIYKTTNSGESWVQQTSPEASYFQCITFVNADTGWACGTGGTVIKTTNGGTNWFSQTFTGIKFNSLDFIDANTGYICGINGIIWKTINGGSNWVNQPSGIIQNLYQIKFMNSDTGFAVGDYAYILKTSTGGNSWEIKNGPEIFSQIFYAVGFNFNDKIIASGTLSKYSTDGGETWTLKNFPAEPINSITHLPYITYFDKPIFFGAGANGYIAEYLDGFWYIDQSPTTQNLYSSYYKNHSNFIWAVGAGGTIIKDIPNWIKQTSPTNSRLTSVYFTDANTGYAVGISGTILKTTNSGTNWVIIYSDGPPWDFNSVYFTDANTGYVVGNHYAYGGYIKKTTNGGINWVTQATQSPYIENLNSVYFLDANTGFTVGEVSKILKTTNSGTNWDTLSSGTTRGLNSVYFTDASTGYIVGYGGTILKTTNSGTNWDTLSSGTTRGLKSVYFLDANTGYSVGSHGTILKTTNGGTSWIEQVFYGDFDLRSVYFIDANVGYVCGSDSANTALTYIFKTSNGGDDWSSDERPREKVGGMSAIQFVVENNTAVGFAVGAQILRTSFEYFGGEPGGNSGSYPGWVQVNSGTIGGISGVDYINPFVAFAVGGESVYDGMILRTINGGQTWTRQQSNVYNSLGDVSFADVNNGIAVGGSGTIAHTTNSGAEWVPQTSGTTQWILAVDMFDINNAFACGGGSIILHTSNGGVNWQKQTSGTSGYWWDIDYINPTTATAVGIQGKIIRTTNAGVTWLPQTGGGNLTLLGVKFIDVNNGIAISSEGPVLRTTDGGTNWVQTDSLSGTVTDISYADSNNVFVVTQNTGDGSRIYHSTNGGLNWILQNIREDHLMAVSFADANNGLIMGLDGLILRTSNSGVISGDNNAYKRNDLNLPIGDFQNTDDSINVIITDNPSAFSVSRVYVTIDTVLHTNDGDLEFYLEHNGITDTLIYQNGEGGENFLGTFLNDETNFPLVSGTAPFRGSFEPYRPLSKFNGQNPDGYWKLRIYDRAAGNTGTLDAWSLTLLYQTATDVTDDRQIPTQYLLSQNFPNPFNPSTTIRYGLTQQLLVTLKIYNILGQEVATLVNEEKPAGSYEVNWNASNLSSGVYFYRLQTGSFVEAKKMILLK